MTTTAAPARTGLASVLNGVGAVVVGGWLVTGQTVPGGLTPPVVVVSLLALAAWLARVYAPLRGLGGERFRDGCAIVMVVAGALMVVPTSSLLITPAIVAVSAATAEPHRPLKFGSVLAVVGMAIVSAGVLLTPLSNGFLAGCAAGFALGLVVGFSRRQARIVEVRERELLERSYEVEAEQSRSALLADRATIARDIHDVLAHSLGGLVIQLDAVEALLEAGRTDDARGRVVAARSLAAEGLGEARRAVSALRDPGADHDSATDSLAAPDAFDRLLDAHRSLGGTIAIEGRSDAAGDDVLGLLDTSHRRALAAVTREALSNARRHAPGEPVTVSFDVRDGGAVLAVRITNRVPSTGGPASTLSPTASPGGGHGLVGMRERFAELDGGGDGSVSSRITAAAVDGAFVVDATLTTRERERP